MAFGQDRSFRPKPGRFGAMLVSLKHEFGVNPFTVNVTVTQRVGAPAGVANDVSGSTIKSKFLAAGVSVSTLGSDPDGTMLLSLIKRRASDNVDVVLATSLSVEADGLTVLEQADFSITASEDDLTFALGDVLEVDLINDSAAITTQPVDMKIVAEFALLH